MLATKLSYLEEELKMARDIANSASLEVEAMYNLQNKIDIPKPKPEKQKAQSPNQESKQEENDRLEIESPSADPLAKKAFRKIALKTHPDKLLELSDGPIKESKKEIYQKASKALEEGNLLVLANIAMDLGIEPPEITEEHIKKAENEISSIKKEIKHIESTYVWKWFYCHDKKEKDNLLKKIFELIYEKQKNNTRT